MAWSQSDLDAFDAQLKARGSVDGLTSLSGESVSFASLEEAVKFRAWLAGLIAGTTAATGAAAKNIRYATTDKGV